MPSQLNFNILISSAGHHVDRVRAFQHSLHEMNLQGTVLTADANPALAPACMITEKSFHVPTCRDPEYIPAMLDICQANKISLLLPTIDPELSIYAEHQAAFEKIGTKVIISSPETIAIASDKQQTHQWLSANKISTPRQCNADEFIDQQDQWSFPILIKPTAGSGSVGVAIVSNLEELKRKVKNDEYVVQTIATGVEYTVDVYINRDGKSRCAVPRQRIEVRSGEVFKAVTLRNSTIQQTALTVGDLLPKAYGPINVQMFYNHEKDQAQVIEINARIGGGSHLAWQAGAKYTNWLIEDCLNLQSTASDTCWKDRLTMLRYMDAIFIESVDE